VDKLSNLATVSSLMRISSLIHASSATTCITSLSVRLRKKGDDFKKRALTHACERTGRGI
jgi:hypothetical protein